MSRPKTKQSSYTNPAFCQQSEYYDSGAARSVRGSRDLRQCKSPQRRQSPVGAQTMHILDTSIRSIQEEPLPPRPSTANSIRSMHSLNHSRHYEVDDLELENEECDEEQEFYEEMIVDDRGAIQDKKFVVIHQQHVQQSPSRYDYIPLQQQQQQQNGGARRGSIQPKQQQQQKEIRSRMASPPKVLYHEEVDASTGRLHRYATIPTDDELDEDFDEHHEEDLDQLDSPQPKQQFALVPVSEVANKSRYAVITQEDIANASIGSIGARPSAPTPRSAARTYPSPCPSPRPRLQTPNCAKPIAIPTQAQHNQHNQQNRNGRPPPNPAATQKLHELLTTPKKSIPISTMSPLSPISPIQPLRGSNHLPPKAQQKLNYSIGSNMNRPFGKAVQPIDKRHTAIVAPICSSPVTTVYHETTFSDKMDSNAEYNVKSNPAQKTIAVAAFMMILCGAVTTGLSIYMISYLGRNYYLDFGILSGSICFLLGLLGFRSRHVYWLPNRNYISGYFVLSVFSLLTCCGLLVLLVTQPRPGTLLADMTSGAVCGISGLSLGLAAIGLLASYCCNVPPPDNRVQHCAPGFNV